MHWYSDSNLNSFQRTHSAAPTPDPLNLLLSSPQFWLQRLLFAMLYPFHTFCSTGIQQTIKAEPFPISSSCVFPKHVSRMANSWPPQSCWLRNHQSHVQWRRHGGFMSLQAVAAPLLQLQSTLSSHQPPSPLPRHLLTTALGDCIPLALWMRSSLCASLHVTC